MGMMNLISEEYLINTLAKPSARDAFLKRYTSWEKLCDLKELNLSFWRCRLPNGADIVICDTYYPVLNRRIPVMYGVVKDKTDPFARVDYDEVYRYLCRIRNEIIEEKKEREGFVS